MTMERVRAQLDQSDFFLSLMRDNASDAVKFDCLLSAFLCSFGSVFQRLEHLLGQAEVRRLRKGDTDWHLLYELRHDEVHRNGAVYYRVPTIRRKDVGPQSSRFSSRLFPEKGTRFNLTWDEEHFRYEFANRAGDLVQICSGAVGRIREHLNSLDPRLEKRQPEGG